MNNNNPLTEIGLLVLSVAMLAAMTVLLITGKINYVEALNFLIVVAGLFGINVAAKAPSPAQQAQLQQLTSQALSTLPAVVAATQQPTQTIVPPSPGPAPVMTQFVTPGTAAATYIPPEPASMMAYSTQAKMPAVAIPDQVTQRVAVPPTP